MVNDLYFKVAIYWLPTIQPVFWLSINCSVSNRLKLHAIKQQLFMIIISPCSGRWLGSAGWFWLLPLRQLQADGGWAVRLLTGWSQLENSFTHMPGAWTRRIQTVVGWSWWVSLSFHLSNTVTWGGQTSQMRLRAPKLCYPAWRVMQGNFHHILSFRGESLEEPAHLWGRGISLRLTTGRETNNLQTCFKTTTEQ